MFDFSFWEFALFGVVALIILGPSRLPEVARTLGLWIGRARRTYTNFRMEVEREVGMDDIRRQLHNEQVIAELKSVEEEAKSFKRDIDGIAHAAQTESQKLGADSGHPQSSNDEALKVAKET